MRVFSFVMSGIRDICGGGCLNKFGWCKLCFGGTEVYRFLLGTSLSAVPSVHES